MCSFFFSPSFPLSLSLSLLSSSSSWSCSYREVCGLHIPMGYMYTLCADCLYLTLNMLMFELLEITQRNLKLLKSDSKKPLQLASTSTWQYIWFTNKWLFYLSISLLSSPSMHCFSITSFWNMISLARTLWHCLKKRIVYICIEWQHLSLLRHWIVLQLLPRDGFVEWRTTSLPTRFLHHLSYTMQRKWLWKCKWISSSKYC